MRTNENTSKLEHEFTRRSALKRLGIAAGTLVLLPLTGCYDKFGVVEHRIASSSEKISRAVAEEARVRWKEVFELTKSTGKGSKRFSKKKIETALVASSALVNHMDEIGLNSEVDDLLDTVDPHDDQIPGLDALISGLRSVAMPEEMTRRMRSLWTEGNRRTAIEHIRQKGGTSAHIRHVLQDLENFVNASAEESGWRVASQSLPGQDSFVILTGCREAAAACSAAFAVAAIYCAYEYDCGGAVLVAAAVCGIAISTEKCN